MAPSRGQNQGFSNKTTSRQHHILISQGRCFKCHKKGHLAKTCPQRLTSRPTLAELPVELLEQICEHLAYPERSFKATCNGAEALRLVCRRLNDKLHDYYGREAFKSRLVKVSYQGLQRLNELSQSSFAAKVERIVLVEPYEVFESKKAYKKALKQYESTKFDPCLQETLEQQDEMAFVERSGTLAVMLLLAFLKMRNLRTIEMMSTNSDRKSVRRAETGSGESTTQTFSAVVTSLAHAHLKLHKLHVNHYSMSASDDGIALQALAMPQNVLDCMSELCHLRLRFEINKFAWKNPTQWHRCLATFLSSCRKLKYFDLDFANHWTDTERIFGHVARNVDLPHLKDLKLSGIRCETEDLTHFLASHPKLKNLHLKDLDLTGRDDFACVLKSLETGPHDLKTFRCSQIAQKGFRTYFKTLGLISTDNGCDIDWSTAFDPFYDDFVTVGKPNKYAGEAEEWEGVQNKIGLLLEDMQVSTSGYLPERSYQWYLSGRHS